MTNETPKPNCNTSKVVGPSEDFAAAAPGLRFQILWRGDEGGVSDSLLTTELMNIAQLERYAEFC